MALPSLLSWLSRLSKRGFDPARALCSFPTHPLLFTPTARACCACFICWPQVIECVYTPGQEEPQGAGRGAMWEAVLGRALAHPHIVQARRRVQG